MLLTWKGVFVFDLLTYVLKIYLIDCFNKLVLVSMPHLDNITLTVCHIPLDFVDLAINELVFYATRFTRGNTILQIKEKMYYFMN